jgi:exonuclease III
MIVLYLPARSGEKSDDTKDSLYEELEQVFDHFTKYHVEILLGDFNAKLGRGDIFKPKLGMRVYIRVVMMMVLG